MSECTNPTNTTTPSVAGENVKTLMNPTSHSIIIQNPEKHGEGLKNAYISYEITSTHNDQTYRVRRRYQDFLWLYDRLCELFMECVIPPLPEKNRMEYLGRFTPDFIKRRLAGLRRFLERLDRHPKLSESPDFLGFLQSPVVGMKLEGSVSNGSKAFGSSFDALPSESTAATTTSSYLSPVLEGLGDVIKATFFKTPDVIDETFLKLRKRLQTLKGHISHLERLFNHRLTGHQPAIVEGLKAVVNGFEELSSVIDLSLLGETRRTTLSLAGISVGDSGVKAEEAAEALEQIAPSVPMVKAMFARVAAAMNQCANVLDRSTDEQEIHVLAVLLEYVQYCDAALEVVLTRDRRQVEVEELTKLIGNCEGELKELHGLIVCEDSLEESPEKGPDSIKIKDADLEDSEVKDSDLKDTAPKEETVDDDASLAVSAPSTTTTAPAASQTSLARKMSLFSYLSLKWETWRGVDPFTARQTRIVKLEQQLLTARHALLTASDLYDRTNDSLVQEVAIFEEILKIELGRTLQLYIDGQGHYHETNLVYWKDFLAWLEHPPKHLE